MTPKDLEHLSELAWRLESYRSVYDCARELREFVLSKGGVPARRKTFRDKYLRREP